MTALTSDEPDWNQQLSGLVLVAENVLESWNSHQKVCVSHELQNICKRDSLIPMLLLIAWTNAADEVIAAAAVYQIKQSTSKAISPTVQLIHSAAEEPANSGAADARAGNNTHITQVCSSAQLSCCAIRQTRCSCREGKQSTGIAITPSWLPLRRET